MQFKLSAAFRDARVTMTGQANNSNDHETVFSPSAILSLFLSPGRGVLGRAHTGTGSLPKVSTQNRFIPFGALVILFRHITLVPAAAVALLQQQQ